MTTTTKDRGAHASRIFRVAERMKILGDSNRLGIMQILSSSKEASTAGISAELGIPITNLSAHVKLLRATGLIEPRRDGARVFYHLTTNGKDLWKRIGDLI